MRALLTHPLYRLVCFVVVVVGIVAAIHGYSPASQDYYNGLIVCVVGLGGLAAPYVVLESKEKPPKD